MSARTVLKQAYQAASSRRDWAFDHYAQARSNECQSCMDTWLKIRDEAADECDEIALALENLALVAPGA